MESKINLILGSAEALLAMVILIHLGRFWRAFPWLAALAAFFVLRGMDRIYVGALGQEPLIAPIIIDGTLLAVVALLLVGMGRTVFSLRRSIDDAEWQKVEYERALIDYRTLVRHRLANPLTIVLAGVETLRRMRGHTPEETAILEDVYQGVQRLRRVSVEAETISLEEETLDPKPKPLP